MTWRTAALCADTVTSPADDLWFSDDPADITAAKAICRRCPSRRDCSQEAEAASLVGMWGGDYRDVLVLSEDPHQDMQSLYNEGLKDPQIAEKLGVTARTVKNWRVRNNLPSDRTDHIRRAMHAAGHTDAEIAAATGVNRDSVTSWRKRRGLPTNNPRYRTS